MFDVGTAAPGIGAEGLSLSLLRNDGCENDDLHFELYQHSPLATRK